MNSRYLQRGVSATKEDVHQAIKDLDKGLYDRLFCKVYPDLLAGDADFLNVMSSDGSGTKSILAYLYWKETGDASVWAGIAQDALVMNLDDLLCIGATGPFLYSSVINRNKHLVTGEAISAIIQGTQAFCDTMADFGIQIKLTGGETADLGDVVRTATVDGSMVARMHKKDLIYTNKIKAGNVIVGLASYGKSSYETEYNSGIGSNGLTSARHDTLSSFYAENYAESFNPLVSKDVVYSGSKRLTDKGTQGIDIGKLLLSPTRTFAPVLKTIYEQCKEGIHSVVHCTGGAHTKVLHFAENVHIIKDNLPETPYIFSLIQEESNTDWKEMYQVFNMGVRMELYVDENIADEIIAISNSFNIDAWKIGHVEQKENGASVTVKNATGVFTY